MGDSSVAKLQVLEDLLKDALASKNSEKALQLVSELLTIRPGHQPYSLAKAQLLLALQREAEAVEELLRVTQTQPSDKKAYMLLSGIYRQAKSWDLLIKVLEQGARHCSDSNLISSLAGAYVEVGLVDKALQIVDAAIKNEPQNVALLTARGSAHRANKDLEYAERDYQQAYSASPKSVAAINNLAVIKRDKGKYQEAIELFSQAIRLEPERSELYYNRGNAYSDIRQYKEALQDYKISTEKGSNPSYFNNYANALKEVNPKEAVKAYTAAIHLNPKSARPVRNRGTVYRDLFRYDLALKDYQLAYKLDSDYDYLLGDLLHTKMLVSDWSHFEDMRSELVRRIREGSKMTSPFPLVALIDDPEIQRKAAEIYGADKFPLRDPARARPNLELKKLKRFGFYSADFHNHATMHLMEGFLERLREFQFELYAFSFGIPKVDPYKKRIEQLFDQVIDVHLQSDQEIGDLSRRLNIDIAFDLKGYTQNCRPTVFAERLAPVQINYLGYPGTTGLPYIDYIIADDYLIPPGMEHNFSEKVIRLSRCYQPNNPKRGEGLPAVKRSDYGLREELFVFASFNNNYKITPECFEVWLDILMDNEKSVLWLFCDNDIAWENLRIEAQSCGVGSDRLIRATRCSAEENLARQRLADLFLDSWPCGGHTTASDAIWMGLPIVTMQGSSFCSRVPGSLLTTLGAPSLIASSIPHYRQIANKIAKDGAYRETIRLFFQRENVLRQLYDTKQYTQDFVTQLSALLNH